MLKNKLSVSLLVAAGFLAGILLISFSPSVETFAQRIIKSVTQFENNWQYCAITRINVINPPPDRLVNFVGNVEITYFIYTYDRMTVKESYTRTEGVTHEMNYAEFLQERNLKNNAQAQTLASQRAADLALAKAMVKLGGGGWEMTGRTFANFNFEGTVGNFADGNSEYKNSLYFRRLTAQKQTNSPQQ